MKNKIFLGLLLTSLAAAASEYESGVSGEFDRLVQTGAFYKPAELPIKPKNYDRAVGASVRIGADGATCSAVLLSKDGYVATAIHCIEECLKPTWNYRPIVDVDWLNQKNIFDAVRVREQVPTRLQCPDFLTSHYFIWDHRLNNMRIVWMGRGYITQDEKQIVKLSPSEFSLLKDLNEDIAILKYDFEAGETHDIPCVPIAEKASLPGAPVWALGFPVRGGSGYAYNGYKEYASVGRVRAQIDEDPILRGYATEIAANDVGPFWDRQKSLWENEGLLLTTLQAAHGNSGGMILNENGELAALLFSIVKSSDIYNGSSVVGVSLSAARANIRRDLGDRKTAEIFNCPR